MSSRDALQLTGMEKRTMRISSTDPDAHAFNPEHVVAPTQTANKRRKSGSAPSNSQPQREGDALAWWDQALVLGHPPTSQEREAVQQSSSSSKRKTVDSVPQTGQDDTDKVTKKQRAESSSSGAGRSKSQEQGKKQKQQRQRQQGQQRQASASTSTSAAGGIEPWVGKTFDFAMPASLSKVRPYQQQMAKWVVHNETDDSHKELIRLKAQYDTKDGAAWVCACPSCYNKPRPCLVAPGKTVCQHCEKSKELCGAGPYFRRDATDEYKAYAAKRLAEQNPQGSLRTPLDLEATDVDFRRDHPGLEPTHSLQAKRDKAEKEAQERGELPAPVPAERFRRPAIVTQTWRNNMSAAIEWLERDLRFARAELRAVEREFGGGDEEEAGASTSSNSSSEASSSRRSRRGSSSSSDSDSSSSSDSDSSSSSESEAETREERKKREKKERRVREETEKRVREENEKRVMEETEKRVREELDKTEKKAQRKREKRLRKQREEKDRRRQEKKDKKKREKEEAKKGESSGGDKNSSKGKGKEDDRGKEKAKRVVAGRKGKKDRKRGRR